MEVLMQKLSRIAAAAAVFVCVPAGVLLAQNAPNAGTGTATTPAPTTAPAGTSPATTTAAPPATTTEPEAGTKKKKSGKMTRQQEIDKSVESGTVPSRYRKSIPKEYQQYIPFAK
jgi:hypothetical protein